MIAYSQGDVVLVEFAFADQSGYKLRPAVVLSTDAYHQARQEVIVAAITSNVTRRLFGDHLIGDWQGAGLLYPSVATGIIRTITRSSIHRQLGTMAANDLTAFALLLRQSLGL
jgi:mRNA interferase MazF